jgi:hypothetical protein
MYQRGLGGDVQNGAWISPYGTVVHLMNSKPINYSRGGMIKWEKGQYNPLLNDLTHDNKPVLLEVNSLVIPRSIVPMVLSYLGKRSINVPMIRDKNKLTEVIVMPEEMIIPKRHANEIKRFLAKNGITLPLDEKTLFSV